MAKKRLTPKVSVVITVLNEQDTISVLLHSLQNQSLRPDEIVVVDGGSTDKTVEIGQNMRFNNIRYRFVIKPGVNRSVGRNYGVSLTNSPIVVFTDAGCIPERHWLKELIRPFSDPDVQVVSGFYHGLPKNIFQKCLTPYVLVMPDKAGENEFFPSTRSMAITRFAWDRSGGFDPRLNYNEDYPFAHWLKKIGYNFFFARNAVVGWIPRKNLKESARMFFFFAMGDIQAGIFRPKVKLLLIRYVILLYLTVLCFENPLYLNLLVPLIFIYIVWSILKNMRYVRHPAGIFWLPVIQITADLSVIWGTLIGFLSRIYGVF